MASPATRSDALRMFFSPLNRLTGFLKCVGTIAGVAPLRAGGLNGAGIAALASHNDGLDLCYRAPGSSVFGATVRCESDGDYLLEDGEDTNKWLLVKVAPAFLLPTQQQARVFLRYADGEMVSEQAPGNVANLSLRIDNVSASKLENVRVWCPTDGVTILTLSAPDEASAIGLGTMNPSDQIELTMQLTVDGGADPDPAVPIEVFAKWQAF